MAKKPEYIGEKCSQCRFYHTQHPRDSAGYCRRFPPVFVGHQEDDSGLIYEIFQQPVVETSEWCGEFAAVSQ